MVVGAKALAPTSAVVDAVYENGGLDTIIKGSAGFDTIVGVDSTTLLSGHIFETNWEYILVRDAITGTGSDSVAMQVRVDAMDGSGNVLYTKAIDSLITSAGEAIAIPLWGTIFGSKIRIKLIGYTGSGGQVILNRMHIYKRRPVVVQKMF
jgi:ribosomal protein S28E/S33